MTDVTSKSNRGKLQVKPRKNGKYRLVITHVHEDQLELIKLALESAGMPSLYFPVSKPDAKGDQIVVPKPISS